MREGAPAKQPVSARSACWSCDVVDFKITQWKAGEVGDERRCSRSRGDFFLVSTKRLGQQLWMTQRDHHRIGHCLWLSPTIGLVESASGGIRLSSLPQHYCSICPNTQHTICGIGTVEGSSGGKSFKHKLARMVLYNMFLDSENT